MITNRSRLAIAFAIFILAAIIGIVVNINANSVSKATNIDEQKSVQTELEKHIPPNEQTDGDLSTISIDLQSDDVIETAEEDTAVEKIQSPYKIARSLEDIRLIIEMDDGTIPVTNIEVPEILDKSADGIIITEQDLDKALEILKGMYFAEDSRIVKNLVTAAVELQKLPSSNNSESLSLLDRYEEFGVYFDKDKNLWMYNDMPIGVLTDGLLVFVGFNVDTDENFSYDKIDLSAYVFLNVTYERVDMINSIVEITPQQAAKRIQAITEMDLGVINLLSNDEKNQ